MTSRPVSEEVLDTVVDRLTAMDLLRGIIGSEPVFLRVLSELPRLAKSPATVVVEGETGTGKELVARALHYLGPRAAYPFVAINCGAVPDSLLEDELFGHETGAFTDARKSRVGLIQHAQRGTLFLDEVECLSPRAQAALLRIMDVRTFRPLGSNREQTVDVRFIAATNVRLEKLTIERTFREDLYYRLNVLTVRMPPLRDRRGDILPLAHHFILKHSSGASSDMELLPEAAHALLSYDWPGNVRQLENVIVRGITLAEDDRIVVEHLGLPAPQGRTAAPPAGSGEMRPMQEMKRQFVSAFERDYLTRLMHSTGGNVTRAALAARKDRRELGKLLAKHGIDPRSYASARE